VSGRSQYVAAGGERSETAPCESGVPQGSVLVDFKLCTLMYRIHTGRCLAFLIDIICAIGSKHATQRL